MTFKMLEQLHFGLVCFSFVQQILYCVPSLAKKKFTVTVSLKRWMLEKLAISKRIFFLCIRFGVKWQFFWAEWKITAWFLACCKTDSLNYGISSLWNSFNRNLPFTLWGFFLVWFGVFICLFGFCCFVFWFFVCLFLIQIRMIWIESFKYKFKKNTQKK